MTSVDLLSDRLLVFKQLPVICHCLCIQQGEVLFRCEHDADSRHPGAGQQPDPPVKRDHTAARTGGSQGYRQVPGGSG